jgi:nicotinamidase-related amidase
VAWVVPSGGAPTPWQRGFYGDVVADLYAGCGGRGPLADRLWHELEVEPGDVLAEKRSWGAFFPGSSDLQEQLEARGVDTIVVTGTVTNLCVETTVREAATLGYRVVLVADACAANRDEDHHATLHVVYRSFGDVRSTDEVVGLLGSGVR